MRITQEQIEVAIEELVNEVYDGGSESVYLNASLEDWEDAVWSEVSISTYSAGESRYNPGNRFDGKENTIKIVRPILIKRLEELKVSKPNLKAI